MLGGQFADLGRADLKGIPVVLGLPWRVVRWGERMEEGMQIAARQVVFFVPVGGRKNDVGVVGRRVHTQVDADHQVEFAGGRIFVPVDALDEPLRAVLAKHVVVRAHEVLETIFVSTHARADEVATPDPENLGMVVVSIDIFEREAFLAL